MTYGVRSIFLWVAKPSWYPLPLPDVDAQSIALLVLAIVVLNAGLVLAIAAPLPRCSWISDGRSSFVTLIQGRRLLIAVRHWAAVPVLSAALVGAMALMSIRGIGVTILLEPPPLPFQLVGILAMMRLTLLPFLLFLVLATQYERREWLWIRILCVVVVSIVTAVVSGSRLVGVVFGLAIFLVPIRTWQRVTGFAGIVALTSWSATQSRFLLLPTVIERMDVPSAQEALTVYSDAGLVASALDPTSSVGEILRLPVLRMMGFPEWARVLSEGHVCNSTSDAWQQLINFLSNGRLGIPLGCKTPAEIYGGPESFGGVGFDFIGTYLFAAGSNLVLFFGVVLLAGVLLGGMARGGRRLAFKLNVPPLLPVLVALQFLLVLGSRESWALILLGVVGLSAWMVQPRSHAKALP